jgi:hypothetical protein
MELIQTFVQSFLNLIEGKTAAEVLCVAEGLAIWYFYGENKRLKEDGKKKDEKIDKIIDDYYKGNLTLTEALNSLKLVLFEIKGKI